MAKEFRSDLIAMASPRAAAFAKHDASHVPGSAELDIVSKAYCPKPKMQHYAIESYHDY